jgi:hypothetical protein
MSSYPQANVRGIFVFFLIEFQPSFELNFFACGGDFAGEAHKLQLSKRSRHHSRPGPEKAQGNHYHYC